MEGPVMDRVSDAMAQKSPDMAEEKKRALCSA